MQITSTGIISLPSVTTSMIDGDTTGKAIVTKEYLSAATAASNYWTKTGDNIANNNSAFVGIGTTNPRTKLEITPTSGVNFQFTNSSNRGFIQLIDNSTNSIPLDINASEYDIKVQTGSTIFINSSKITLKKTTDIIGASSTEYIALNLSNSSSTADQLVTLDFTNASITTAKIKSKIYLGGLGGDFQVFVRNITNTAYLQGLLIEATGLATLPSTTNALITADATNKAVITKEYLTSYTTTQLAGKMNNPSLTASYIPKALTSTTIGNSRLFDTGTKFGIGTTKTPTLDLTFGNQDNITIGIEQSSNTNNGRDLILKAGRTINFVEGTGFQSLNTGIVQNTAGSAIVTSAQDVYVATSGDIYKRTSGAGTFVSENAVANAMFHRGMGVDTNGSVYVCMATGGFKKKTNNAGLWVQTTATGTSGTPTCVAGDYLGNLYFGTDVALYKQTGLAGSFASVYTGGVSSITISPIDGSIYIITQPQNAAQILKQTAGTGSFDLVQSSAYCTSLCATISGDIFVALGGTVLAKQTAGAGLFVSQGINITPSSMVSDSFSSLYAPVSNSDIFFLDNNAVGSANLDGGFYKNYAGTGKGTGKSRWQVYTGQKTTSGTNLQTETLRMEINEDGLATLPSVTNALITADATGKAVVTKEYLIATMVITLYIALSGNDSAAIPNNSNYPYASFTAVFNYINTLSSDNFKIILLDVGSWTSNTRIPNKNIAIYGSFLGGATTLSFNTTTLSNASVIDNSPNTTGNRKLVQLEMYNITISLSTGQSFRNENCMLICENFSVTSSSSLVSFAYSAGLIVFNSISGGFNTITISSGSNTYGGVIGTTSGIIRIKSLVVNAAGQYFAREFLNRSVQFHIQSISGTGSITLSMLSKPIFYLYNITINGTVTLTNQGDNDNIFIFNNSIISGSTIVNTGEGYGYVTGSINDSSTNGLTLPGFLRTGSIIIFKDFKGVVTPSIVYPTASSEIHFINCNIKFTGVYLIKLNSAINNNLIKFIGVNTFVQTVAGDLLDSSGTSFQIEKRGVIYTNSTSLGTGVTVDDKTPNTY